MFFDNLRTACANRNTTVTAIVEKIGMSKGSIANWKKGATPTGDKVAALARELDVTTDYLLGRSNDSLSEERKQLIELAQSLPGDKVRAVLTVAKTIE